MNRNNFYVFTTLAALFIAIFYISVYADEKKENNSKLTMLVDIGKKFTDVFGYENSDISDDIMYSRYSVSFNQKASPSLSYEINQLIEKRNYDQNTQFDNNFTQTYASMSYKLPESGTFIIPQVLRTGYLYKNKNYVHTVSGTSNDDYRQNKFNLGISYVGDKENWAIDYDTGINSFDYKYNSFKNENKYFNQIQLKKKFWDKKLNAFAGYKIQYADRKNKDNRTEPEEVVGFDLKPGLKYLSLVSLKFEHGKSETREEDVREDQLDFKYDRLTTRIEIPIVTQLKNMFGYKLVHRKYSNSTKSYHFFKLDDTVRYTQFDRKDKCLFYDLTLEYKESDFIVSDLSNNRQIAEGLSITYEKKKDWKIKSGATYRIYTSSPKPSSDSERWVYTLNLTKTFSPDLSLDLDFRKEWRHYYKGPGDRTYESIRLLLNYAF